jgi:hypothetical protein
MNYGDDRKRSALGCIEIDRDMQMVKRAHFVKTITLSTTAFPQEEK